MKKMYQFRRNCITKDDSVLHLIWQLVPARYSASGTRYSASGTRYSASDTRYSEPGSRYSQSGTRYSTAGKAKQFFFSFLFFSFLYFRSAMRGTKFNIIWSVSLEIERFSCLAQNVEPLGLWTLGMENCTPYGLGQSLLAWRILLPICLVHLLVADC